MPIVREGVKYTLRGEAEGREALAPPKIWEKDMYPPPLEIVILVKTTP